MTMIYSSRRAAGQLVAAIRQIHARGWAPATSSNFSVRLNGDRCAITVSGRDKGSIGESGIMLVDLDGNPLTDQRPSAETLLHTQLYRRNRSIGAVLHTHSPAAVAASRAADGTISLAGLELLKAFSGVQTHDTELNLPVFDNSQDIRALAGEVDTYMDEHGEGVAYLIRGHGSYVWGDDLESAMRQLEALEALLTTQCQ